MGTLGVIFAFGGLVVGVGMTLYALWVGSTVSVKAGWKMFGGAQLVVVACWFIGAALMKLGG